LYNFLPNSNAALTMGINEWFKACFKSVKTGKTIKLSTLSGQTIGVDVSIWLRIICSSNEDFVFRHHMQPFYPPLDFLDAFKSHHNTLLRNGITPLYVFDGIDHPMKALEKESRIIKFNSQAALTDESLSDEDLYQVKSLMKQTTKPTEEMKGTIIQFLQSQNIRAVNAPSEAEWQLLMLEKQGIIHGLITEDSDAIALGAENVYVSLSMHTQSCYHFSRSRAIESKKMMTLLT
jgi:exonuclease-1